MKKEEFIKILKSKLVGLSDEDINEAVEYYEEYLSEVPDDKIDDEIEKLGRPEYLAEQIKSEITSNNQRNNLKSGLKDKNLVLKIILVILLCPIWLPLLAAYATIYISVIIVIVSVCIAFPCLCIMSVAAAFGTAKYSIFFTMFYIGVALVSLGATIILAQGIFIKGICVVSKFFGRSIYKIYNFIFSRK